MNLFHDTVAYLRPGAQFVNVDNTYAGLEWRDPVQTKPSESEILAALALIDCWQKRVAAYPPIGDQLDALYRAGLFPPEMAERIKAVKAKYPKP